MWADSASQAKNLNEHWRHDSRSCAGPLGGLHRLRRAGCADGPNPCAVKPTPASLRANAPSSLGDVFRRPAAVDRRRSTAAPGCLEVALGRRCRWRRGARCLQAILSTGKSAKVQSSMNASYSGTDSDEVGARCSESALCSATPIRHTQGGSSIVGRSAGRRSSPAAAPRFSLCAWRMA